MKKLLYLGASITLCLLFSLFVGCEKNPLEETGGGASSGDGITTLEGVVTSKDKGKPVLLASVTLLPTDKMTLTDTAGSFRFRDIAAGTYKLQVKRTGYATYTSADIKVSAGKTVRYNIALESEQSDLQIQNTYGQAIDELAIEDNETRGVFVLKNTGGKIIEWEIPKLAVNWISDFSMQSGKLAPGASERVEFSIDRSKLSDGLNETILYIGSSVGDKELAIKVGVERSFSFTDESGEEILEVDMSDVDQYRFIIKNTGNDVFTWSLDVDALNADWLTFVGKADGILAVDASESRTLRVNRTALLEEGIYETALVFHSNAGEKTLPIKIKIEMGARLEDEYGAEITEVEFGSASNKNFRIRNTGNGTLTWTIPSVGADWLTFSNKRSGSLQPNATETITMTIDYALLSEGDNRATVNISTNAGDKQLDVSVHVELSYRLVNAQGVEISELDLGRTSQGIFNIKNTGGGVLRWNISPSNEDWLVLNGATQGQILPNNVATVELTIDKNKMEKGNNETVLSIHTNIVGGDKQLQVKAYRLQSSDGIPEMVYVEGGTFWMGATEEQGSDAADDEKPAHQVTLDGFYIGKYEVTQAQWEEVMGTTVEQQRNAAHPTYSLHGVGEDYPMYYVNLMEATAFCEELSRKTGKKYRLPTEAEWEYAARGGHNPDGTKYAGSNAVGQVAWYKINSNEQTQPAGMKQPNGLGVYDMSGNVYEWCSDKYGSYSSSPVVNPQGPSSGSEYVRRGGGTIQDAPSCRVSFRNHSTPDTRAHNLGFRVVQEL